jgi:hypothetical protein
MCNAGFVENIKVFDVWVSGKEQYRLINPGAGPDKVQVQKEDVWVDEKPQYSWGVLTARFKELVDEIRSTDNNDPNLCLHCENQSKWPKCMKNIILRGYHSVYKESGMDEVVSCDAHTPIYADPQKD